MAEYLLIEFRDPFESNDVGYYCELARGLVEAGNEVTLFLVQNAVLAARPSAQAPQLRALAGSGIKILADDFALKERGITNYSTVCRSRQSRPWSTIWKQGTRLSGTRRLTCPKRPSPSPSWIRRTSRRT